MMTILFDFSEYKCMSINRQFRKLVNKHALTLAFLLLFRAWKRKQKHIPVVLKERELHKASLTYLSYMYHVTHQTHNWLTYWRHSVMFLVVNSNWVLTKPESFCCFLCFKPLLQRWSRETLWQWYSYLLCFL